MKPSSVLSSFRRKSSFALAALVATFLIPFLTSPTAMAFGQNSGDPFGNGTFFPTDGTFQTTIRGKNLSGVATFSTGGNSKISTTGTFSVSYQGTSYSGNVDGSIDPAGGTIAATLEASVAGLGSGTTTETLSSAYGVTGTATVAGGTAVVNLPDQVTVVDAPPALPVTTTISGLTQTITLPDTTTDVMGWMDTIAKSTYQDTAYVSGAFTAKLKNSFPNQIFKGNGTMTFTSINFDLLPPQLVSTEVSIGVKGVRISDTAQTYTPKTVQAPSIITTTSVQNRTN